MTITVHERTASTLAAIERFSTAFNEHDVDGVMAASTEGCIFENTGPAPDGERYEGAAAVQGFWPRFPAANPRASFAVEGQFAAGDRCVVCWRYDWSDGHVRGVDRFRVRDGLVTDKLCYVKG